MLYHWYVATVICIGSYIYGLNISTAHPFPTCAK